MTEICPNCGATSVTDLRTDDGEITCYNCGENFEEIPDSGDGFSVADGWQEENARRQLKSLDYESLDDGEDDPDLDDPDIED